MSKDKEWDFHSMLTNYGRYLESLSLSVRDGVLTIEEARIKFQEFLIESISRLKEFK